VRKRLPKILALVGAGATSLSILAAFLVEAYSLHTFFRYDYVLMAYVVLPLLVLGIPMAFIGTVWWARQLEPATRIAIALVLFFLCVLIFFSQPNIHGAGGLLLLFLFPAVLLGAILLGMGSAPMKAE
jgi:hypothetical protein